jgi:hypothetical protein
LYECIEGLTFLQSAQLVCIYSTYPEWTDRSLYSLKNEHHEYDDDIVVVVVDDDDKSQWMG